MHRSNHVRTHSLTALALILGLSPSAVVALPVYFADTGSYYDYIVGTIWWTQARDAASALTFIDPLGHELEGYLATVTSGAEDDFLTDTFGGDGWLGGSDQAEEGVWRWMTGPEAGLVFWDIHEDPPTQIYANWAAGEPNDHYNEDYLHKLARDYEPDGGRWNDSKYNRPGFYVEFAGGAAPIPEPTTLGYLSLGGVAGFAWFVRRRRIPYGRPRGLQRRLSRWPSEAEDGGLCEQLPVSASKPTARRPDHKRRRRSRSRQAQ